MSVHDYDDPMRRKDPELMDREELEEVVRQAQDLVEEFSTYMLYTGVEIAKEQSFADLYNALSDEENQ